MHFIHEVQYFRLRSTGTMHHSVNVITMCIQNLLDDWRVGSCWRKYQFTSIQFRIGSFCQSFGSAVHQFFWNWWIEAFWVFCRKRFVEYIVTGRSQSVTSHSSVVFVFVGRFAVWCQSYNNISSLNSMIRNNVRSFHATNDCRVHDNSSYQIANIRRFTSSRVNSDPLIAQIFQ